MKCVLVLCMLGLVGLSMADTKTHSRGCIYILGRCYEDCPEGTHAYALGCGYKTPEATCDDPNPVVEERGIICDYSACYCDPPTVRDTESKKCVPLEQCAKKTEEDDTKKEEDNDTKKEEKSDTKKEEEKDTKKEEEHASKKEEESGTKKEVQNGTKKEEESGSKKEVQNGTKKEEESGTKKEEENGTKKE